MSQQYSQTETVLRWGEAWWCVTDGAEQDDGPAAVDVSSVSSSSLKKLPSSYDMRWTDTGRHGTDDVITCEGLAAGPASAVTERDVYRHEHKDNINNIKKDDTDSSRQNTNGGQSRD